MKKNLGFKLNVDVAAKYIEEYNTVKEQKLSSKISEDAIPDVDKQVEDYVDKQVEDYVNKWVDRTINVKDWHTFRMINFWEILNKRDLTSETFISIQDHQLKILDEFLSSIVKSRIKEENLLDESRMGILIDKNLNILKEFLTGTPTDISIKRAKNIIEFDDPAEVLVLFDEIINDRYLFFEKYTIFSLNKPNSFSSYFVASYLWEYQKELKILKKECSNKIQNVHLTISPNTDLKVEPVQLSDVVNDLHFKYILKLLEDLAITTKGKSMLSQRRKCAIRGVVEGLKEGNVLPNQSLNELCGLFANQIGMELKSKLDWSPTSDLYKKKTLEYIKTNPLH